MLQQIRRRRAGQAIVIMALAMVAICGMLALAIDAGRLYFQRRLMQDAVDAGALAGAQDLVGTLSNPNGVPANALFHALQDTFSVFNQTPTNPQGSAYYVNPPSNTVTDSKGGYTVTAVAPSGYNNKQVQVTVTYNAVATFVQVLGFNSIAIMATATAEAGTNPKTYAVFAYGGVGTGNTINAQEDGAGQVDNGQDGNDFCSLSSAGITISNAKFHIPTGTQGALNIDGRLYINQGSDNQNLYEYWYAAPAFSTGQDPEPDYLVPDTSQLPTINPGARWKIPNLPAGSSAIGTGAFAGVTITNSTSLSHDYYVYVPGRYSSSVQIPWNSSGDALDSYYIFLNGIYYFTGGNSLQITGGHISNTSTGLPHYANGLGATDLPDAPDGTNGIEFIFDGSSFFNASNSAMPGATDGGASVFFVAPSIAATGTNNIAFFIGANDNSTTAWSNQGFDGSTSNAPRFQVWGTIFDASAGGTTIYLRAVQVGPHNLSPTDANSGGQYAVNGEFIGYTMTLDMGSVYGNANGAPPLCSGGNAVWSNRGTPGLLVQFNPAFAPQAGVNSSLVK